MFIKFEEKLPMNGTRINKKFILFINAKFYKVEYVKRRYPDSFLGMIGISAGSGLLVNYLGNLQSLFHAKTSKLTFQIYEKVKSTFIILLNMILISFLFLIRKVCQKSLIYGSTFFLSSMPFQVKKTKYKCFPTYQSCSFWWIL